MINPGICKNLSEVLTHLTDIFYSLHKILRIHIVFLRVTKDIFDIIQRIML